MSTAKIIEIHCPVIEGVTHSTFQRHLQHSRQLRRQISGVQQQGLAAPQWSKNLAESCFREGTEKNVQKYMIHSRLLNVWDCYVKSHLVQAGIDSRAPYMSCQIQWTQPSFRGTVISQKYTHGVMNLSGSSKRGVSVFESCDKYAHLTPTSHPPHTQFV